LLPRRGRNFAEYVPVDLQIGLTNRVRC
jgi:hypothetical protein